MNFDFEKLMSDPQFMLGLSLMSQWKTPPGQFPSLGAALENYNSLQNNQYTGQLRKMQMEKLKNEQMREQKTAEWEGGLAGVMEKAKPSVTDYQADNPFNEDLGTLKTVNPGDPLGLQQYLMKPESPYRGKLIEQQLFPAGDEAFTLSPGQKRFKGGQVVAEVTGEDKPEASTQLAKLLKEQAKYELGSATWKYYQQRIDKETTHQPGTTVNVAGAAFKEHDKSWGDYAIKLREGADTAARTADEVNYVVSSLQGYGGGPLKDLQGWAGKFAPDSEWGKVASAKELADTVQAKLAPTMRAVGSGATSDFEMKMWMKAIPTLATTETGRALMQKYTNRVAERAAVRAQIEMELMSEGNRNPTEINRRMKEKFGDMFLDPQDKKIISGVSSGAGLPPGFVRDKK